VTPFRLPDSLLSKPRVLFWSPLDEQSYHLCTEAVWLIAPIASYTAVCSFPTNSHITRHTAWPQAPSRDRYLRLLLDLVRFPSRSIYTDLAPLVDPWPDPQILIVQISYSASCSLSITLASLRDLFSLPSSAESTNPPNCRTGSVHLPVLRKKPVHLPLSFLASPPAYQDFTRVRKHRTAEDQICPSVFSFWHDRHVPRKSLRLLPISQANCPAPCSTFPSIILQTAPPRSFPHVPTILNRNLANLGPVPVPAI
jgi:hypothetical protein